MPYISINNDDKHNYSDELIKFYENNIVEVAKLLGCEKTNIPQGIMLQIEEGSGASYSRSEKKIIYRFEPNNTVLDDMGRLIHEAAHVVQNYSFNSNRNKVTMCWTEGIADYCRAKLDVNFNVDEGQNGDPDLGYKEAACFLIWLSKRSYSAVVDLNDLLARNGHRITGQDQIFLNLRNIKEKYRNLKLEYFTERKKS